MAYQKQVKNNQFPLTVFHPEVRKIIDNLSDVFQVDSNIISSYILNTIGFSLLNKYYVRVKKGWYEKSNLWTLIIDSSGSGKSPLFKTLLNPIRKKDEEMNEIYDMKLHQWMEYQEAIKKDQPLYNEIIDNSEDGVFHTWCREQFGDDAYFIQSKPTKFNVFVEKTTFEKLNKILSTKYNDGRSLMITYDEFLGFMSEMNQYSKGSDEQTFLKLWGYEGPKVSRQDDENNWYVKEQNVSLVGTSQPHAVHEIVNEKRINNGLPYRLLFELGVEEKKFRDIFKEENYEVDYVEKYNEMIYDFLRGYEIEPNRRELILTHEARKKLREWTRGVDTNEKYVEYGVDDEQHQAIKGKMHCYVMRVAIIINRQRAYFDLETENNEITLNDIDNSIKIIEYYWLNIIKVLQKVSLIINVYFKSEEERNFYDALPLQFKYSEFISHYMKQLKKSTSTAEGRIRKWMEFGIIRRNRDGMYYKTK